MLVGAIAVMIAASGCGSDSSGDDTAPSVSIPTVTTPELSTTAPAATHTGPETTTTGKGSFNPNEPDSATNDVPPPPGSPQEAFEKQCEANPQACG